LQPRTGERGEAGWEDRPGLPNSSAPRHTAAFAHPACEVANLAYFGAPPVGFSLETYQFESFGG